MRRFINDDFLLETPTAHVLYHEHAAPLPIIDFHSHLAPERIASDHSFRNLTELWLHGDHYKWRALRANGFEERYCSGSASDREKFIVWAETVEHTQLNPLFHWTHLELQRVFGIQDILRPETADNIYDRCNGLLAGRDFSTRALLKRFRVEVACTTDDPADSLDHHETIRSAHFGTVVLPTFRADLASAIEDPVAYGAYLDRLGLQADIDISTHNRLLDALRLRHDAFNAVGCRLSDHGETQLHTKTYTESEIARIFQQVRRGQVPSDADIRVYKSWMLFELARMDHESGWVQQFHLGALRNPNSRLLSSVGPDSGGDTIGSFEVVHSTARFLDRLDREDLLAPTILYNINPRDTEAFAALAGSFNDGSRPGRVQVGAAWWFMDQLHGMERHLSAISSIGLLSRFVGMVTDSRSFLSYARHEYFRRLLCNFVGSRVESGQLPRDEAWLGGLITRVCYSNARDFFGWEHVAADEEASE